MFWIVSVTPVLIPSSVVPISQSIHAAFPVCIGQDILSRWTSGLESTQDLVPYRSMLVAFQEPNVTCLCQYNTRGGLTIFAIQTTIQTAEQMHIVAYMRDPWHKNKADKYVIQDLHHWFERVRRIE